MPSDPERLRGERALREIDQQEELDALEEIKKRAVNPRLHCVYCLGGRSIIGTEVEQKEQFLLFQSEHGMCGPKAVGMTFEIQ